MFHPWRAIPDDVRVEFASLPPPTRGRSRDRSIVLHNRLRQVERRCTVTHEVVHIERGDMGKCDPRVERDIDQEVARRLIAFDDLAAAIAWSDDIEEVADELWVTPQIARARLDCLWPREVAILAELVADLRA